MIAPPSSWSNLQNKPTILTDNQIHWDEIQGIPPRVNFLANTLGQSYEPSVLSDFYGQRIEWMALTSLPNPWTMVQRNGNGGIQATNFKATALPSAPDGLSSGNFYQDSGFVKVVI